MVDLPVDQTPLGVNIRTCPFCGARPVVEYTGVALDGWHVRCTCPRGPSVFHFKQKIAIQKWNLRDWVRAG